MKTTTLAVAFMFLFALQLIGQGSSVKILINNEERFRFEDDRLEFVNPAHNVLIGDSAGANINGNTDAAYNVFMGYRAGFHNDTGKDNVFIGDSSGYYNLGGNYNTALGSWSGWHNTEGTLNTFFGASSGAYNTTGSRNSYFGTTSGFGNDTGSYNCFFGYASGGWSQGSYNVFIGRSAGLNNKGDSSVFLGFRAGQDDTTSHKLYIANSETWEPLVYGEFDNKIIRFNAKRVEIRNPGRNTFIGDSTGVMNTGAYNVFIGSNAGYSNTDGNDNLFIGNYAGWSNATGSSNVILGSGAGPYNQDGHKNVMVGVNSGYYNTSGYENVFLGTSAGGSNTTGACNTYLGRKAGLANEEGDSSIFIGYFAGAQETNSHKLYIDNSETTAPLIYGEFDNDILVVNGNLGVGETNPAHKLHVVQDHSSEQGLLVTQNGDGNAGTFEVTNSGSGGHALNVYNSGNGYGMDLVIHGTGTGAGGRFTIDNASNDQPAVYAEHKGTGNAVEVMHLGANGNAGRFMINNAGNSDPVLLIESTGTGPSISADGAIQMNGFKMAAGASAGYVLTSDGSGSGTWQASTSGDFSNGGEAGNADRTLGNTDNYALSFKTNNLSRLKIQDDGGLRIDGNVGIFTDPSSAILNRSIQLYDSGTLSNPYIQVSGHNSAYMDLISRRTGTTSGKTWRIGSGSGSVLDLDRFTIYNADDGYCFAIRDGGNVGIQELAPGSRLVVKASGSSSATSALNIKDVSDNSLFYVRDDGNVGIGDSSPTAKLDINGTNGYDQLRMRTSFTPTDSNDARGNTGDIAWDDNYIYVKTASAGWKRTALTTF